MTDDYTSTQSVEVLSGDSYNETVFTIGLKCTAPYFPGSFDPYHGGEPPSGPEFEMTTIYVMVLRVNRRMDQSVYDTPLELNWNQFVALVGEETAEKLFNDACIDAAENGGF